MTIKQSRKARFRNYFCLYFCLSFNCETKIFIFSSAILLKSLDFYYLGILCSKQKYQNVNNGGIYFPNYHQFRIYFGIPNHGSSMNYQSIKFKYLCGLRVIWANLLFKLFKVRIKVSCFVFVSSFMVLYDFGI